MPIDQIARIIAETLDRFGKDAPYSSYQRIAFELFPEEMRAMGDSFARAGFTKWLKDGMRRAVSATEEDPDVPQIQLDLLPGLAAPAFVNVGSWKTPKPIRFTDCTLDDLDTCITTRKTVYSRQGARIEDLQMKREWLLAHGISGFQTIGECIEGLGGNIPANTTTAIQQNHSSV